jgi:hypothetical protein
MESERTDQLDGCLIPLVYKEHFGMYWTDIGRPHGLLVREKKQD